MRGGVETGTVGGDHQGEDGSRGEDENDQLNRRARAFENRAGARSLTSLFPSGLVWVVGSL